MILHPLMILRMWSEEDAIYRRVKAKDLSLVFNWRKDDGRFIIRKTRWNLSNYRWSHRKREFLIQCFESLILNIVDNN